MYETLGNLYRTETRQQKKTSNWAHRWMCITACLKQHVDMLQQRNYWTIMIDQSLQWLLQTLTSWFGQIEKDQKVLADAEDCVYLQRKATCLGHKSCSKAHVVTVNEWTCIAITINNTEIDGVTWWKWLAPLTVLHGPLQEQPHHINHRISSCSSDIHANIQPSHFMLHIWHKQFVMIHVEHTNYDCVFLRASSLNSTWVVQRRKSSNN